MTSFKRRQIVTFKKVFANPKLLAIAMKPSETDMQQGLVQEAMRNQIEAPTIGAPAVVVPAVGTLAIVGDNTLPLGDIPLLGQYQFSALEKTAKPKREGVGREVNFKAISSKYGSDLLETMVVAVVAKTDVVFINQEEAVGEAYQILEVEKTEDEASQSIYLQASTDQTTVVSTEEQTIEVVQTDLVIFHQEEDIGEASKFVLIESEVDVTLKKKHALTEDEINERAFIMVCRMNQLHAHLDELLPGVLLESFIQRPISQDEKNQVGQVWSLRKDELFLKAKKNNKSTYMRIGEEVVCLNALYTLYPK
ncbi:hypothetical protein GIB67_001971 [Kingdonia uniflora]|uniref:Uncharacterized protein n=1 Tax=Kingdonia uniflora TaxID=39325 RepID=A0A7J7MAB0_9MAGN|nr:hypothetical protein GIB67_001971 [Kingdonia uniflora]